MPRGTLRVVPGGLTSYPAIAPPGKAVACLNVDLSDYSQRTRRGVLPYPGNLTEGIGGGVDSYPTYFTSFRAQNGAVYELRAYTPDSGNSRLIARHGIGGGVAGPNNGILEPDSNLRTDALWDGTEFNGQYVIATDPQPAQDGRTLVVFHPVHGWSNLTAIDRAVTPFHGSALFYGIDGDDEGPYLNVPPKGRFVASHNGRLFVAGLTDEVDGFRYSNTLDIRGWPGNNVIRIKTGENQGLTAMHPLGRLLVFFKPRSIHVASILSQYDAQVREVVTGVGCVNHATVKAAAGRLIFLAEDGVYSFDGQGTEYLSQDIELLLRQLKPVFRCATAVYYRRRHQYWLTFPSGIVKDGLMNDRVFVYDLRRREWAEYQFAQGNMGFRHLATFLNNDGEETLLAAAMFDAVDGSGVNSVYYLRMDSGDRDYDLSAQAVGSRRPIVHRWVSSPITLENKVAKRWQSIRPTYRHVFEGTYNLWWQMDHETRTVAQDNTQEIRADAFGDYQEQDRSLFGTHLWGAGRYTEQETPYVDRIPLHGAYGRTVTVGFERTAMQGHLDVQDFDLEFEAVAGW